MSDIPLSISFRFSPTLFLPLPPFIFLFNIQTNEDSRQQLSPLFHSHTPPYPPSPCLSGSLQPRFSSTSRHMRNHIDTIPLFFHSHIPQGPSLYIFFRFSLTSFLFNTQTHEESHQQYPPLSFPYPSVSPPHTIFSHYAKTSILLFLHSLPNTKLSLISQEELFFQF